jgi:hypothetical protein
MNEPYTPVARYPHWTMSPPLSLVFAIGSPC